MTLYAITPTILEGDPPQDHGTKRRCVLCKSRVNRYQAPCRESGISALLCSACQRSRREKGVPLSAFVGSKRTLAGGRKSGQPLPGLKRVLDSRKMASWELSEASGVSRRFVEDLRAGRKRASEECASVLARTLGVGVGELRA